MREWQRQQQLQWRIINKLEDNLWIISVPQNLQLYGLENAGLDIQHPSLWFDFEEKLYLGFFHKYIMCLWQNWENLH